MRALLRGERVAGPLLMGALIGMFAVALAGLILAIGYRSQFSDLKRVIYSRCQQRDAYDTASQQARAAQRDYYQRLLTNLRRNPSPQSVTFNAELERSAQQVIDRLDGALRNGAPRGCGAFK